MGVLFFVPEFHGGKNSGDSIFQRLKFQEIQPLPGMAIRVLCGVSKLLGHGRSWAVLPSHHSG